jgi:hypothetical protein
LYSKLKGEFEVAGQSALLALALIITANNALARPDTRVMTCAQAKTYLQQNKAIVMSTGQHTYTRIVSNQGSCSPSQTTRRLHAPTIDNPKCQVGNECRERTTRGN